MSQDSLPIVPPNFTNPTATNVPVGPAAAPAEPLAGGLDRPISPRAARATTDSAREACETFVFVVVLVMLLRLFVAEAFVIPTGSMAETLFGDQVECQCRECEFVFPMNASANSISQQNDSGNPLYHYTCPNCGFRLDDSVPFQGMNSRSQAEVWKDHRRTWTDKLRIHLLGESPEQLFASSGDRVLVSKYDYYMRDPKRFDVPVFKYPVEPFSSKERVPFNYIKRLVGLPGETVATFGGDLYVATDLDYSWQPKPNAPEAKDRSDDRNQPSATDTPAMAWLYKWMYPSDPRAIEHFHRGKFRIVRKSPEEILAVRRIVFDFDHQPRSLAGGDRTRWEPSPNDGTGWKLADKTFSHSGDLSWMRYGHRLPGWSGDPQNREPRRGSVTDHLGYNNSPTDNWVPDLSVETEVAIGSGEAEVVLELNRGPRVYSAVFARGECQIGVRGSDEPFDRIQPLAAVATRITSAGTYHLRLANIDSRLTVWVNNRPLALGAAADYDPRSTDEKPEPTAADRDRAVRIGAKGDVRCAKVRIHRDIFYTCTDVSRLQRDHRLMPDQADLPIGGCSGSVQTFYVQPDHILCFGDNSNSSSDGRVWGLVPQRLLLGRAVMVYWPYNRIGVIE